MKHVKIFAYGTTEYRQALALRDRILRKPLGLQFTEAELKKDEFDTHLGLFEDDKVLACLTLTETENRRMKMRQVAVDESLQGKGLGTELSLEAEKHAADKGYTVMFCHARKVAVPFYQKLGYKIVGDEFAEVNIPHYVMEKEIGRTK